MARKTVKIEIPVKSADEMFKLAEAVSKKHNEDAANSPLKKYDFTDFDGKMSNAKTLKAKGRKLDKEAQSVHKESDSITGNAEGQSVNTKGTLYNLLTRMRDTLLDFYEDEAEKLGEWGFKVVTGEAKSPTKKTS